MRLPTIHLNGTSREALLRDIATTVHALREALSALSKGYPNARDYYPQGPDAIGEAQREHEDRMRRVRSVVTELETIWEGIAS